MNAESRPVRRTRLLAILVLVVTFVSGVLIGVASQQVLNAREPDVREERRLRSPERDPFGPDGRLTRRLELTEAQRAEISTMLAADRAKADSIFREMRPKLRARYDSTTARIRRVLTPEQQAEFDRYREERRERVRVKIRRQR